ncbi:MAG: N-(5'-phosphoribosyl)anthranilate isomerase [Pseudomonadota bacterium]
MPATFARPVLTADGHLLEIFSSKAACSGGVIRRKARDIDRFIGREVFMAEVHRRGFRAIENAGQIVVFCNSEPVRRLV